ncbi:MAG: glycerol kinase GlpK [Gemmataceae bacterium]|nr:glycerol kinase GlpK [Gemmataceae bacterium]MDW8267087.1 glycerol kinase GlpK [Gemmataceae bacterium]
MTPSHVLAIDQGTTGTRAVVYDRQARVAGSAAIELTQHYPQPGWVEHDGEEIWQSVATVVPRALAAAGIDGRDLAAVGLTNQRETTLVWERATGRPVARAIVWQDRRTIDFCRSHHRDEVWLHAKTGLVLDPYFSATKLRWLLEHDPDIRANAAAGRLAFGTVDSFLIHRLTGGAVHATDASNASRTLLLNLDTARWDDDLCRYFAVPPVLLPEVRPSSADFGVTRGLDFLPDGLPITGVAGDQQAALFGQGAFEAGQAKCTYGTGAFFLMHVGTTPRRSRNKLLTTLAATLDAKPQYALEGSVFVAGAAVQWLRDGLRLFSEASAVEGLAARSDPLEPIVFVPAFVGLGTPYWKPEVQGAVFGLTRSTSAADLARAALEGVAFQVVDLVEAASDDAGRPLGELRVDGGMSRNTWFLQCQADLLGIPVLASPHVEATALGAAFLAGLRVGFWSDLDQLRRLSGEARRCTPRLTPAERQRRLARWRRAVQAVISYHGADSEQPS